MAQFLKSKTVRQFLPFMVLVIGGSFFLREFTKIRYKYRKTTVSGLHEEAKKLGIELSKPCTLEEEYEKTMKKIDLDNWENVRIPRPWEETDDTK